jgi:hypothetical protein
MKSLEARCKQTFLRNSFFSIGYYGMPLISKDKIDLKNLVLLGFHNTRGNDDQNRNKTIHFFIDDYKFNGVWNKPDNYVSRLKQYKQLLSPDFSIYADMPRTIQIYNTFRRRWCSVFWQNKGIAVIPAICWSDDNSFDFCFEGIMEGSIVAVSTHGTSSAPGAFMSGFQCLCEKIKPEKVICFCKPYDEMNSMADIIHIEHEGRLKSSVKSQNHFTEQFELF